MASSQLDSQASLQAWIPVNMQKSVTTVSLTRQAWQLAFDLCHRRSGDLKFYPGEVNAVTKDRYHTPLSILHSAEESQLGLLACVRVSLPRNPAPARHANSKKKNQRQNSFWTFENCMKSDFLPSLDWNHDNKKNCSVATRMDPLPGLPY